MSRVPAINGYLSLVCSNGRHAGCRPEEQASCSCRCHRRALVAMTNPTAAEPPASTESGSSSESPRRAHTLASGKSPGLSGPPQGGVVRRRGGGSTF